MASTASCLARASLMATSSGVRLRKAIITSTPARMTRPRDMYNSRILSIRRKNRFTKNNTLLRCVLVYPIRARGNRCGGKSLLESFAVDISEGVLYNGIWLVWINL